MKNLERLSKKEMNMIHGGEGGDGKPEIGTGLIEGLDSSTDSMDSETESLDP